jgi:NAD(P)-dependent dehydrogenase (short-subunit alcohol dehydrogenase family)
MSVVLISGANSGIGQLAALAFARAGHAVAAGTRSLLRARELQQRAETEDLRLAAIHLDVTDPESIASAVKETEDRFGPIDVLVNNAGVVAHGAVEMVSEDTVRTTFETNFYGPLRLVKAVLPAMRSRGQGAIVLVGSLQGILPSPGAGIYGASKVAAAALNDALACEVEPLGIRVVTVEVGPYRTGIEHKQSFEPPQPGPYGPLLAALGARGARRLQESADPDEVADTIVALAFRPDPPLRVPVGKHAERYLSGPTVGDRFRADLRTELADLLRQPSKRTSA